MTDLVRLVEVYRHGTATDAGRGIRGRGAHQSTTDDDDATPRHTILGEGQIRSRCLFNSGHARLHGMDSTCSRAVLRAWWCW